MREFSGLRLVVFHGGEVTIAQSIELFRQARVVVGVHGAGLANILFCAPGATLIEVPMLEPTYRDYMHAAAALDIRYWVHAALPARSYRKRGVEVPPRPLARLLRRVLRVR